jgi:predicted Zn-dependent protease
MDLAVAYSQTGNHDEAASLFQKLISFQPDSALLHFNLATVYAHRLQFAATTKEYKKALELDPTDDTTRLSLAKALASYDQLGEALPYLLDYTRSEPADFEGCELLGRVYREQGRFDGAVEAPRRAVELKPRSYDGRH